MWKVTCQHTSFSRELCQQFNKYSSDQKHKQKQQYIKGASAYQCWGECSPTLCAWSKLYHEVNTSQSTTYLAPNQEDFPGSVMSI